MTEFSVVIPTFNHARRLPIALDSVLKQDFQSYEVIIVNDGSSDDTDDVARAYLTDKRISYVKQSNAGVSAARNSGIVRAGGEYVAFLDADDEFEENCFSLVHKAIGKFRPDVIIGRFNVDKGRTRENSPSLLRERPEGIIDKEPPMYLYDARRYLRTIALKGHPIIVSSIFIKKSLFQKTGMFDVSMRLNEDLELWDRVFLNIDRFVYIDKSLSTYNYYLMSQEPHNRTDVAGYFASERRRFVRFIALLHKIKDIDKSLITACKRRICSRKFKTRGILAEREGCFLRALTNYLRAVLLYPQDHELYSLIFKAVIPLRVRDRIKTIFRQTAAKKGKRGGLFFPRGISLF